jgi:hypothetical protein
MAKSGRWFRLWRSVRRWWLGIEPPHCADRYTLYCAKSLLGDYQEMYAKRVGLISDHARQAADIVEAQGLKRGPSIEGEIRTLAQVLGKVINALESLDRDA